MGRSILRGSVLHTGLRTVLEEVCERDLEAELKRLSMLDGGALGSRTARSRGSQSGQPFSTSRLCLRLCAHRHRRLTASAVSDRASLESACHALAIGYSLRRHRLATSRGYGLLWLRRSRDNRGREEWRQTA